MKKTMIVLLTTAVFATSCSKSDVDDFFSQPAPNNNTVSIAPVTGRWEAYKRDDVSGSAININTPNRDTLTILADKTYAWKSATQTTTGTVNGVSNTEFRLYANGTNNLFNTTLRVTGNELKAEILLGVYYLRRI